MNYSLIVLTAAVAIFGWVSPSKVTPAVRTGAVVLIVIAALAQGVVERHESAEKRKLKYAGRLEGGAAELFLAPGLVSVPELELGDTGAVFEFRGPQGMPLLSIFDENHLTIWTEQDRIRVSTVIRNRSGEVIAQLAGNEWSVRKEKVVDRNFNDQAMEVIDETGDVILQVKLRGNRVQFQGKFYGATGQGVAIGRMHGPMGSSGGFELTGSKNPVLTTKFTPMFRYPSELHLGELAASPP